MQIGYLDPASGSIIASALVGGTAAVGVAVKSARRRFVGAFKKSSVEDDALVEKSTDEDVTVESDA